jgi:hypothetical protein
MARRSRSGATSNFSNGALSTKVDSRLRDGDLNHHSSLGPQSVQVHRPKKAPNCPRLPEIARNSPRPGDFGRCANATDGITGRDWTMRGE